MLAEALKHTATEELYLGFNEIGDEGAEAPLRRESGSVGKGWDEFPTETLRGRVEFRAEAANLEGFESSGFRSNVFNKITQYLSCPNLFSLWKWLKSSASASSQTLFNRKYFFGTFFLGFDLLLHDIARQQAS